MSTWREGDGRRIIWSEVRRKDGKTERRKVTTLREESSMDADRRGFLGAMIAAGMVPMLDGKASPSVLPSFRPSASPAWDLSWLDKLKGAHRAVFDCVQVNMGMG